MIPREIDRMLKEYDPALRFIHSRQMWDLTHKFRVERHVQGPVIITPKPPEVSWEAWSEIQKYDDRESAKEKYLLIFDCWPNQLDQRIFWTLILSDLADYTPGRKSQEIKTEHERRRAKSQAAFGDRVAVHAKEWAKFNAAAPTLPMGNLHNPSSRGVPDPW